MVSDVILDRVRSKYSKYGNNRELVLYGCTREIIESFESKLCSVNHIYTRNKDLLARNNTLYFNPDLLKDKKEEVYVVISLFKNGGIYEKGLLEKFGYKKDIDYIFLKEEQQYSGQVKTIDDYRNEIETKNISLLKISGVDNQIVVSQDTDLSRTEIIVQGSSNRIVTWKGDVQRPKYNFNFW